MATLCRALIVLAGLMGASGVMLAAASGAGVAASMYYLLAYTVTNLATFIVVIVIGRDVGEESIAGYAGLARRSP